MTSHLTKKKCMDGAYPYEKIFNTDSHQKMIMPLRDITLLDRTKIKK